MSFGNDVQSCIKKFSTLSGRASRSEYWSWVGFSFLCYLIATVIDLTIGAGLFYYITAIVLFLPSMSVYVRRVHDIDLSGWWLLVMFVPIVNFFCGMYFTLKKGTNGANRFGEDPLGNVIDMEPVDKKTTPIRNGRV